MKISRRSQLCFYLTSLALFFYISLDVFIARQQQQLRALGAANENMTKPQLQHCRVPPLTFLGEYIHYIYNKQVRCENLVDLGGKHGQPKDGQKFVCLDPKFNIIPDKCVVLSFGINNEWSFEEDAALLGCKVYAFDPTMGKKDHKRSSKITFKSLGISNHRGLKKTGMSLIPTDFNFTKEYPVDSYENILKMLNLTNTPIDIIKMDVELSEVDFLQDILYNTPHLLRNIKQMAIEIHHDIFSGEPGPTHINSVFWPLFHHLGCNGFKIFNSRDGGFFREVLWAQDKDWS